MGGGRAERIEAVVDRVTAAVFAAAVAYVLFNLMSGIYGEPQRGGFSAAAAAIAYVLTARGLRRMAPDHRRFTVPEFELPAIESPIDELLLSDADRFQVAEPEPDELLLTEPVELLLTDVVELVLTDADRVRPAQMHAHDELVLDDIVAELGPGSRVVRLFDPAAMQTPGQINARIERHLDDGASPTAPPDASQALYDALAELRRSLR